MKIKLKYLSLTCFLLPIITVVLSYIWSVRLNLVAYCMPNFEGCTSISKAGRYEPVKYFFKPLMFIHCLILFVYWFSLYKKIYSLGSNISSLSLYLSILSVLFLLLYIFFLGEGKTYTFFRKVGVLIYIFFTIISQFFFSYNIKKFGKIDITNLNYKYNNYAFYFTIILIFSAILLLPIILDKTDDFSNLKNIISWNYFLSIQIYFLINYFVFKG